MNALKISSSTIHNIIKTELKSRPCKNNTTKNHYWISVILGPAGSDFIKNMILPWKLLNCLKQQLEIFVCEYSLLGYPQLQVKL